MYNTFLCVLTGSHLTLQLNEPEHISGTNRAQDSIYCREYMVGLEPMHALVVESPVPSTALPMLLAYFKLCLTVWAELDHGCIISHDCP